MKDIMKGLWKWILAILIFLILFTIVLMFRIFIIDKNYGKNSDSSDKTSSVSSASASSRSGTGSKTGGTITDTVSSNRDSSTSSGSLGKKITNGAKSIGNATVRGYKEDEEVYNYNVHNFDEVFLMFEGERGDEAVKQVLEKLISNSNGTFYARTSVTAVNFGNEVSIHYDGDVIEYQNAIRNLESSVSGGTYDISFKYGALGSYVNEIVITKK